MWIESTRVFRILMGRADAVPYNPLKTILQMGNGDESSEDKYTLSSAKRMANRQ